MFSVIEIESAFPHHNPFHGCSGDSSPGGKCSSMQLTLILSNQVTNVTQHYCTFGGLVSWYIAAFVKLFILLVDYFLPSLPNHISAGAFVICWTPGLVTLLLDGLLGKDSQANAYEKFCLVIAECNSLVNPIIYSLRDDEMRRTFKSILCCLCRRSVDQQRELSLLEIASPLPEVQICMVDTEGC